MALAHEIGPTSVAELKAYLDENNIKHTKIEQLSGGTANYVFRVFTEDDNAPKIYKHAEPYVASSNGAIPFPVDRMDFEAVALKKVSPLMSDNESSVKMPEVNSYDEVSKILILSDAGYTTLKEAYTDPAVNIPETGRELGEWLAELHHKTPGIEIGEGGNRTAKSIYRWAYSHLTQAAEQYGLDTNFCEYIDWKYGAQIGMDEDEQCVCHGDYWPGNIILDAENTLTVVDWEMVRRGYPALDLAQFSAEAYLLERFLGGRGLLDAFLDGYRRKACSLGTDITIDRHFATRFAVHVGVHLAYWPSRVKWAEEEEDTKAVMELGHEFMRRGDAEDMGWLRESPLAGLFE